MPKLVATNLTAEEIDVYKKQNHPITVVTDKSSGDIEFGKAAGPNLSWENVSFEVGGKKILDNVSGSVTGGSVVAILGPSGAGK
jgi:ABC-type multidrug transport system fused ATPase/permease subunit